MPTIVEHDNQVVGHYPREMTVTVTLPGTTSVAIPIPGMLTVEGLKGLVILDSGDRVATSDADVTWSGNTVTIADGGSFTLANTMTIYLTVFGKRRA